MAEITLGDLMAWEPRLRVAGGLAVRERPDAVNGEQNGTDAIADRELTWAVAARATSPMLPPLRGGELVLLAQRTLTDSGVTIGPLLRELAAHDVAAAVMEAEAVPPGVRAVGAPVPILALAVGPLAPDFESELNRLLTERRGELYRTGTEIGRLLAGLTTAGADLGQILAATADALSIPVVVVDRTGHALAVAGDPAATALGTNGSGVSKGRVAVPLAGGETLLLGPVAREARALARMVGERVAVAAEAALARAAQVRPRGPARAAALTAYLTDADPLEPNALQTRPATLGLPVDATFRVALAAPALGESALQRLLAPFGLVHDAAAIDGALAAVVETRGELPAAAGSVANRGRPAPERPPTAGRQAGASGGWLALSGPAAGAAALRTAARQARFVAALLRAGLVRGPVARFDAVADLGPFRLLYGYWGTDELARFATEALGALAARDRRGILRGTLLAYLETGGSHVEAAARLSIHRNTLAYRLKQITALSGHDPVDPANRLLLHLALLAAALPPAPDRLVPT